MLKPLLLIFLLLCKATAVAMLAGGRPNTFSEGNNAFAGVVNPANAVWIDDRFDIGGFWVQQKSTIDNKDNAPVYPPGKTDLAYGVSDLFTTDLAVHKRLKVKAGCRSFDWSFGIATFTVPGSTKIRTKYPIPVSGTTPLFIRSKTEVISAIYSFKIHKSHSVGFSLDYLMFSHSRDGFQNSDNPIRSVSPGNVTNNGADYSYGFGCSIGYRWKITDKLNFGTAWTRKSYAGQYRKYRGFEPHFAHNYTPQTVGGGFSYRFTKNLAGRLEMLWTNLGNLPAANNSILPDGSINTNKRGSNQSPGPGLQDATYINMGMGYKVNSIWAMGVGYSHRIRLPKGPIIISHSYTLQTIYEMLSIGSNFKYKNNDLFIVFTYGFPNKTSGHMPETLGGARFQSEKQTTSLSLSWGYMY
jgi:long-chain fatty acid transport protein